MIRLGFLRVLAVVGLTTGCSSSGKVVVQDGYRAITPQPTNLAPQRPGALPMPPDAQLEPGGIPARATVNP